MMACSHAQPKGGRGQADAEIEIAGRFEALDGASPGDLARLLREAGPRGRIRLRGTLRLGVMAIGGETTGVTLRAGGREWELQLRPKQAEAVQAWSGRRVEVEGRLEIRPGTELARRTIVHVRTLVPRPQP